MKRDRPGAQSGAREAGKSEGLGGPFDPRNSESHSSGQDHPNNQNEGKNPVVEFRSLIPSAPATLVVGSRAAFAYIEYCPLCGLDHAHGAVPFNYAHPLTIFANHNGHRLSHCHCHGLGHIARQVRGGRWVTVEREPPPHYRKPTESLYRLVRIGPAIFTRRGKKSAEARAVMTDLALRGVPTSSKIFQPVRPQTFAHRGD
jgi:hypothetical protein